jgi:hypothetical protein
VVLSAGALSWEILGASGHLRTGGKTAGVTRAKGPRQDEKDAVRVRGEKDAARAEALMLGRKARCYFSRAEFCDACDQLYRDGLG